jgi:anti-anti-sigma factor
VAITSRTPTPEGFFVRLERRGDAVVVVPSGELDHAVAPTLAEVMRRAFADAPPRVVLDLRELLFMDSGGLGVLLTARRQAEDAGKALSLVAGHRGLERTLEIAGVHQAFTWTAARDLA